MRIWRVSNHADLSGRGGLLVDGRWHRRGVPIVYCADHPSTALLEILVHMARDTIPDTYQLVEIEVPDELTMRDIPPPPEWTTDRDASRQFGMAFLGEGREALMRVPSVVMPKAFNILVNPRHEGASRIAIVEIYRCPFDSRLLR